MESSFPKMQKSSASFSQSVRNRLRLKKLQAQAKNFCRVLDIRVPQVMEPGSRCPDFHHEPLEAVIDGAVRQKAPGLIGRSLISSPVYFHSHLPHLLRDLFLRFPCDGTLYLPADNGVMSHRDAGLPIGIGFSILCDSSFSDRAAAVGGTACFIITWYDIDTSLLSAT